MKWLFTIDIWTIRLLLEVKLSITLAMGSESYIRNTTECHNLVYGSNRTLRSTQGLEGSITNMEIFWLTVGFGVFTGFLAAGFSAIRKYIHHDKVRKIPVLFA